jgi:hypothetical protein
MKITAIVSAALYNPRIILLRQPQVVQWIYGELSFLSGGGEGIARSRPLQKKYEDLWGQETLRIRRPDLVLNQQWTNKFGEHICEEIIALLGKTATKPAKKKNFQPDLETDDAIYEVKTGTYYTDGSAHEKILGCPFKYAEIPELYGKPLKILCIGGAEKKCRETYGNLAGNKCGATKNKFLDFYRDNHIEFIGATDVLGSAALACKIEIIM